MTDVHPVSVRARNMRAIRAKNTKPELIVRKLLYAMGFRYRLHVQTLPGSPDLVLSKLRIAVFVHGCFWHGHECYMFKLPSTRPDFWLGKISTTRDRDRHHVEKLIKGGWRVLTVWECALKGKKRLCRDDLARGILGWIGSGRPVGNMSAVQENTFGPLD